MPHLLIPQGAWLTCKNGHRFARAKADIHSDDALRVRDFDFLDEAPCAGEQVKMCHCGAPRLHSQGPGVLPFIDGRAIRGTS